MSVIDEFFIKKPGVTMADVIRHMEETGWIHIDEFNQPFQRDYTDRCLGWGAERVATPVFEADGIKYCAKTYRVPNVILVSAFHDFENACLPSLLEQVRQFVLRNKIAFLFSVIVSRDQLFGMVSPDLFCYVRGAR